MALPYRRKRYSRRRSISKKGRVSFKRPNAGASWKRKFQRRLKRKANQMAIASSETRVAFFSSPDVVNVTHNNFVELDQSLFSMRADIITNDGTSTYWKSGVIGNRYYCKGVSFRFMLENYQDRPYVIYRFMVVRAAHGEIPNRANLFEGVSGNKMLDYIDKDKFTVEYQKWIHVKAPNAGTQAGINANGTFNAADFAGTETVMTRPKKIIKLYWPCKKHIRLHDFTDRETINGIANCQRQKDFNYHVILYGYDAYGTPQDLTNVGYINDYVSKMYNKDF